MTFDIQYQKLPPIILIGYLPDWQYLQKCISYLWIRNSGSNLEEAKFGILKKESENSNSQVPVLKLFLRRLNRSVIIEEIFWNLWNS